MDPYIAERSQVAAALWREGAFPWYATEAEALANLDKQTLNHGIHKFTAYTGLEASTPNLERPPQFFCGVVTIAPFRGGVCRWPGKPVTWHAQGAIGNISAADFKASHAEAMGWINDVCGVGLEYSSNPKTANILVYAKRLDGPNGVLAQMQVPCGVTMQSQMHGQFDLERLVISENPPDGYLDLVRINCHEDIHGVGVDHGPAGNLLAPTYDRRIRKPQAWDIAELQKRYGPPVSQPSPPSVPSPSPSDDVVTIRFRGKLLSINGVNIP